MAGGLDLPAKYRPLRFEDVVGQPDTCAYLSALVRRGRIAKNIILAGSHGSGKTTSARIYARALNCESPEASGSPCNRCAQCVDQLAGRHPDYSEYDAASNSKVEEVRELLQLAKSPPMIGQFRGIVIDEAHALSKKAWDSTLKLVEEPPPYLFFAFATTEVDKIPATIASRCQLLRVTVLDHRTAVAYLRRVCEAEGLPYEDMALEIIAHVSGGHSRDLLNNLEHVTYLSDEVTAEATRRAHRLEDGARVIRLVNALLSDKLDAAVEVAQSWPDGPSAILDSARSYLTHVYHRHQRGSALSLSHLLDLIPRANTEETHALVTASAAAAGVDPEAAYSGLGEYLASARADTRAALNLHLFLLSDLAVRRRYAKAGAAPAAPRPAPTAAGPRPDAPGRRGRQFVTTPGASQVPQAVAAPTPQPSAPAAAPVYAHSLAQAGFVQADPTKVRAT